ncbi:hypothetical protein [Streptomyces acidiscabies]|uniref:Uncharacterized protein n=1 Tax=Streptomyces acidiscabies TaxID=42234 RepID=A0AAP6EEK1_9ACTN|nr:hypothetical protein [Streptomyces acidiscabies]MBP5939741.1 hypothetical protein [Streptomyces sp. LBUM 1476]MBZ3910920.1 hypothetical protein [Streptomyces acidiscabies]MDX2959300.1 hypothetical protein [Streptomyces acidiscabies]MDX3017556.1 hypothetical protein [Streptomyces acidiscabies]MDX3788032.1 hypothetical protein [Streptomyces acidiscabies]
MNSVPHSRIARALAAGAMSVALAAGGATASYAAASHPAAAPKPKPSASYMNDASITVKADKSSVKQGDEVT